MSIWEQLILIFGLAADGFAASVCMGLCLPAHALRRAGTAAASVTVFHTVFFFLGHLIGTGCAGLLRRAAPRLAGAVLVLLGLGLLRDARRDENVPAETLSAGRILTLSFATSIDAASVGFSFAVLDAPCGTAMAMTALVMGLLSTAGVALGRFFGSKFCRRAKLLGGLALCVLGLKNILL